MALVILIRDIMIDAKLNRQQRATAAAVATTTNSDEGASPDHEKHGFDFKETFGKVAAPTWLERLKFNRTASSATEATAKEGTTTHRESDDGDEHQRPTEKQQEQPLSPADTKAGTVTDEGLSTAVPSPVSTPAIEERRMMQPMVA
ncbi:hypothetical protein FRC17_008352 [Serendipita sp. 399]|nr:hypothetical protein FRC17_008352 [Serendipita sp. 399]